VKDLEKQKEQREAFRRRRTFDPDKRVTYVNERNRVFNERLYRYFGSYVSDLEKSQDKPLN